MSRRWKLGMWGAGLMTMSGLLAGCGASTLSGITGSTTLAELLTSLGQTASADTTLSQLTVSDLVQGFLDYAEQSGTAGGVTLTADQQAQLEDLQSQLDSGEITLTDFVDQVSDLVGALAPGHAGRGFPGGAFPHRGRHGLADQLSLNDEQQTQADAIQQSLHDDLETLRRTAHDQIKALLTAEQLAEIEALQEAGPARGPHGRGGMGGHGAGQGGLGALSDELQLTDEQKGAIETIRTDLKAAVKARHEQAREAFRAILTAEQIAILDAAEAEKV